MLWQVSTPLPIWRKASKEVITLIAVLAGIYLISAVGYYRMLQDEVNNNEEARIYAKAIPRFWKILSVSLSLMWAVHTVWTYFRRGVARA